MQSESPPIGRSASVSLTDGVVPVILIAMNLLGIVLGYGTTILLARHLPHADFEQFVGAIATLGLLAALAEAGFGKYGLRVVPTFVALGERSRLRSYVGFALLGTLALSLLVASITALVEWSIRSGEDRTAMLLAVAMLPVIATTGVVVDLLLALRMAALGMFLSRVLVPLTTFVLVFWGLRYYTITAHHAVLFFAAGSALALVTALAVFVLRRVPVLPDTSSDRAAPLPWREWMTASFSFMGFYFLIAWLSRSTLFIASHLPYEPTQLALLAAAMEIGCVIIVLSKSTDKYFLPPMARSLDTTQWHQIAEMRRVRLLVVGCGVALFLATIVVFGERILLLYGEDFVPGYAALCLIALGSSVWTLFSLAPSILLYAGEQRKLMSLLCLHGILLMILTTILFQTYGALGAAAAYAISLSSFAVTNMYCASKRLNLLSAVRAS